MHICMTADLATVVELLLGKTVVELLHDFPIFYHSLVLLSRTIIVFKVSQQYEVNSFAKLSSILHYYTRCCYIY